MKVYLQFSVYNKIFFTFLFFLLLYSFDYSLGWGLNLIFPKIYFFTLGTGNNGFNPIVWNENGLVETLQVIIIFFTLYFLLNLILKKKYSKIVNIFILLQFLGLFYIGFEEISWGQNLIKFDSPEFFLDKNSIFFNKQEEFNLHNTSNIFNEIPRAFVILWCTLSVPILKFIDLKNKPNLALFIKPNDKLFNLSILILFLSIPDLIINKFDLIDNSKLFIFNNEGFEKYDTFQFFLNFISLNYVRFSELQELLIYNYFLWHSIFLGRSVSVKSNF
ncbi:hypothetical protein OA168_04075 [Candidatus Pelagibacter sp.]|nr:hypothetical protein [Candidatus Pelagibacter sp.]